ncbi:MAG: retropepsin-like aspartic protease [Bacteroidota bacterium]
MVISLPIKVLAIDNDGYHLQASIIINGKKANVIIDTGASRTVFDKERIKKFVKQKAEKITDKLSTGLGTNSMESHQVVISSMKIGRLKLKDYETVLLDLSHVNRSYEQIKLKPVDGVLGSDILRKHKAVIDYGKKKMRLIA